jgi:hypothetical protein
MPLYVIDTLVQFRHKYVIEAKELEHAFDEVVMRDSKADEDFFEEVTQRYLGETILDGREITMEDFKAMMIALQKDKEENSSYWMDEKLIRKINYKK